MTSLLRPIPIFHFLCVVTASYDDAYRLESTIFANYSTQIRPVQNFSQPIDVSYTFRLLTVVGVDAMHGTLSTLGEITFVWTDEKLQWDPHDYGGITQLHPYPKNIWHPRLDLVNSLGDVDVFEDSYNPITLKYDGNVTWSPLAFLASLCALKLTQFPFDEHNCQLIFRPIFLLSQDISLTGTVSTDGYEENGEWRLKNATSIVNILSDSSRPAIAVRVDIARRPTFFIINFFVPVTLLSVLNLLTFVLVVQDGSVNIGYSMTVLLAYTIYVSVLIDHIPAVSMDMPLVNGYLFFLFFISLLTTIDIIFIVWLNNKEEEEEKKQKRQRNLTSAMNKLFSFNAFKRKQDPMPEKTNHTFSSEKATRLIRTSPKNSSQVHPENGMIKDGGENELHSISSFPMETHFCSTMTSGNVTQSKMDDACLSRNGDESRDQKENSSETLRLVNRYKNLSDKVRHYSLYVFTCINCTVVCVSLLVLLS